jgi:hypothetical protein
MKNAYGLLVGKKERNGQTNKQKKERKRALRRPRLRCMINTEMDLAEIELGHTDWIDLDQDKTSGWFL